MEGKHPVLLNEETEEGQPHTRCGVFLVRARKGTSATSVFTDLVTDAALRHSAGLFRLTCEILPLTM